MCVTLPGLFLYYLFGNVLKEHWLLMIKLFRGTLNWIDVLGMSELRKDTSVNLEQQDIFLLFCECWNCVGRDYFCWVLELQWRKIRSFVKYTSIVKVQSQSGKSRMSWIFKELHIIFSVFISVYIFLPTCSIKRHLLSLLSIWYNKGSWDYKIIFFLSTHPPNQ